MLCCSTTIPQTVNLEMIKKKTYSVRQFSDYDFKVPKCDEGMKYKVLNKYFSYIWSDNLC